MAVEIKQSFEVDAPIEKVWAFMTDPHRVASCMPGASLDEVVDERHFRGSIRVKVGAVMASYKGKVEMTEADEAVHSVEIQASGTETGGGTASGTMRSSLVAVDGGTRVQADATVELTGKIMQMGRGMIQGVSDQLFKQFVAAARSELETAPSAGAVPAARSAEPLRIVPVLLAALWAAITGLFRRLFGGGPAKEGGA